MTESVRNAAAAIEFYTTVFGAEELLGLTDARGGIKQRFDAEQQA